MGTSRNDRSPDTPNWKPALAAIGNPQVDAERQNLEIWRAAYSESGALLENYLGGLLLAKACDFISQDLPLNTAITRFDEAARRTRESSFVLDLARRAFIRSRAKNGSVSNFIGETFAELVSYYASRDLPSYVGASGRLSDVSDSVNLKEKLQAVTRERVISAGEPRIDPSGWKRYIRRVLGSLQQEGRSQ
jgi:hypothetical protein